MKKREEVFKGIMVRVLDEIEKERLRQEVRCPACEGEVIKKGSEMRRIETLIDEGWVGIKMGQILFLN